MFGKKHGNSRLSKRRSRLAGGDSYRMSTDWAGVRLVGVGILFALAWLGLWGRAFYVQVIDGDRLAVMAARQHRGTEFVEGRRGRILDRHGRVLATSVAFRSVFARPYEVEDASLTGSVLGRILKKQPAAIRRTLSNKKKFVWLAREVDDSQAADVREANLAGVYLTTEYARQYPSRHLAGRLIGFAGIDEDGLEGLERSFDEYLTGTGTRLVVQRDASGRILNLDGEGVELNNRGGDVTLTIDAHIQDVAENALEKAVTEHGGTWGGALVVDVPTGDILAWAEYPHFNPNAKRTGKPSSWRNRLAIDALEPGSTLKPLLVAAALNEKICEPDSLYYCENGRWRVADATIRDTHRYKWLPVDKVVRYSSNICAAKIGMSLGAETYHDYLTRLGFGSRTGLPLPGEGTGIVRRAKEWTKVDLAAISFGQGLSVTGLQMARAYTALANGGVLRPLRLVKEPEQQREPERRVFEPEVARRVLGMLRDVVQEDGTGTNARIAGLTVGGKTGTAQKAEKTGGYGDRYVASFVGFLPAEEPEFLILVTVDEPQDSHYGGVVAAPAFKEVAVKTLAYLGDLPDVRPAYLAGEEDVHEGKVKRIAVKEESERRAVRARRVDAGHVPDVLGLPLRRALEAFARGGVVPHVRGEGTRVARQSPQPGAAWQEQGECVLWLGPGEQSGEDADAV